MATRAVRARRKAVRVILKAAGAADQIEEIKHRMKLIRSESKRPMPPAVKATLLEMRQTVKRLEANKPRAYNAIETLAGTDYKIFYKRYIERKPWETVAEELAYDTGWIKTRERNVIDYWISNGKF